MASAMRRYPAWTKRSRRQPRRLARRKAQAAEEIARTARGLEAAAEEMEGSPLQQDLLREAADGLKQIAHAVEGKSLGTMAAELSEFGRRIR